MNVLWLVVMLTMEPDAIADPKQTLLSEFRLAMAQRRAHHRTLKVALEGTTLIPTGSRTELVLLESPHLRRPNAQFPAKDLKGTYSATIWWLFPEGWMRAHCKRQSFHVQNLALVDSEEEAWHCMGKSLTQANATTVHHLDYRTNAVLNVSDCAILAACGYLYLVRVPSSDAFTTGFGLEHLSLSEVNESTFWIDVRYQHAPEAVGRIEIDRTSMVPVLTELYLAGDINYRCNITWKQENGWAIPTSWQATHCRNGKVTGVDQRQVVEWRVNEHSSNDVRPRLQPFTSVDDYTVSPTGDRMETKWVWIDGMSLLTRSQTTLAVLACFGIIGIFSFICLIMLWRWRSCRSLKPTL